MSFFAFHVWAVNVNASGSGEAVMCAKIPRAEFAIVANSKVIVLLFSSSVWDDTEKCSYGGKLSSLKDWNVKVRLFFFTWKIVFKMISSSFKGQSFYSCFAARLSSTLTSCPSVQRCHLIFNILRHFWRFLLQSKISLFLLKNFINQKT